MTEILARRRHVHLWENDHIDQAAHVFPVEVPKIQIKKLIVLILAHDHYKKSDQ